MKLVTTCLTATLAITGCDADFLNPPQYQNENVDPFQFNLRILLFNGATDQYIMVIEGRCIVETQGQCCWKVVCKTGDSDYRHHLFRLTDNITYFAEELDFNDTSKYHYKVIHKPQSIIPDVDLSVGIK